MKLHKKKIFFILSFIVFVVLSYYFDLKNVINLPFLKEVLHKQLVLSIILFVSLFIVANLIAIPGVIFLAGAVLVFGPIKGGILIYGTAVVSCLILYFLLHFIGGDFFREIKIEWVKKMLQKVDQRPFLVTLLLRIVFQTSPALNYALAFSGIRFRDYCLGTILGLPLPLFLYICFFDILFKKVS